MLAPTRTQLAFATPSVTKSESTPAVTNMIAGITTTTSTLIGSRAI